MVLGYPEETGSWARREPQLHAQFACPEAEAGGAPGIGTAVKIINSLLVRTSPSKSEARPHMTLRFKWHGEKMLR